MNSKKIKFNSSAGNSFENSLDILKLADIPSPAKKHIPDWYKDTPSLKRNSMKEIKIKNFKSCVPFGDSFLTGYMLTTPCDIFIEKVEGKDPNLYNSLNIDLFGVRSQIASGLMQSPENCYNVSYIYKHNIHMSLPQGYSALITHPLNRNDLPWIALSGIVDADKEPLRPGQYPIFIKKDFEGMIPKGTPILQIIPFKRESWKSEKDDSLLKTYSKSSYGLFSTFSNWYKKTGWTKKEYN
jgi:hypothetical protein